MHNIIKETPFTELHGRLLFSTQFVDEADIRNKNVLDIGCGYGWFEVFALSKNVSSITGTEFSEADLMTVKQSVKDQRARFMPGSAISLPLENEIFDTVVSWEVIEHIPKNTEPQMFKEVARVLKTGGIFYLSTPP